MERKNRGDPDCPMARSVNIIGEWGSLMIIREAFVGVTRFDDFQKRLGMSRNLLTARLKTLVAGGVFERRPVSSNGRRLEYVLTPMGEDLLTTIVALRQWGDRWLFAPAPHPNDMVDITDGSRLEDLKIRSTSGRAVPRKDIRLRPTQQK
ncbi:winged helix-turn-helix transcriptional regulator [Paraburkholderia sp. GAS348]|uniref:winged helix-turn-helix transcriptional regulator n=1 Tax=Paraburkholderia sp. GAS348 TaxID=3035132 RepID=UPI003D1B6F25